jgi:Rab11 family-interacting protein 1/2/5
LTLFDAFLTLFSGTNDAFVTIGLGKEKYQTSVKEKVTDSVEWCEQCEL